MRILLISCIFLTANAIGQTNSNEVFTDTIYFMNGDIFQCEILDDSQTDVVFEYKRKKRVRTFEVHKSEIFAVIIDGEKDIYYAKNDIVGDDLTVKEVEAYMAGQRDGKENYNTTPVFLLGLGISLGTSLAGEAGLIAVTAPVVIYPIAQYIPVIKIREKTISDKRYQYNSIYSEGYESVVRGRRLTSALKSTGLGSVLGFTLYELLNR